MEVETLLVLTSKNSRIRQSAQPRQKRELWIHHDTYPPFFVEMVPDWQVVVYYSSF